MKLGRGLAVAGLGLNPRLGKHSASNNKMKLLLVVLLAAASCSVHAQTASATIGSAYNRQPHIPHRLFEPMRLSKAQGSFR